ncbi:zinc ribbon domain-containing protein [Limosilactobacillus fermentum]|uniref:zinc ribbon domain-containing protein n=1 Tax=Limosilactobacillus fermentum TaxID=1613 RepID=UPI000E0A1A09|nr:zinc ribbon domain-containing protein [Limosilactobacillus fermentum]AXH07146.1 zinc ribbon domain-containing protein [Limosilactobacillus fermentum]QAR21897.1 zinc ribbon domain-containing protein [Limosilactobacillus fermentum]UUC14530.1 zinc ribbon domain-containing protein [Limosilactobacillus fermentum]
MSKYCPKCGTKNDEDATFCRKCGYNFGLRKKKEEMKKDDTNLPHSRMTRRQANNNGKKRIGILICLLVLIVFMGVLLYNQSTSNKKVSSGSSSSTTATNYNKLSNKEKQNVQFEFNLQENKDADAPDPVYNINMKIKNNTDKKISFNEGKLTYNLEGCEGYKANSKKSETIVIEPKETKTVKNIFKNIDEQVTVGGAVINYDGKQLLQANFSNSSQSAGTNDEDQSNSDDTTDSTDNNDDTTDQQDNSNESKSNSSETGDSSKAAAIQKLEYARPNYPIDEMEAIRIPAGGWLFKEPAGHMPRREYFVYDDSLEVHTLDIMPND